MRTFIALLLALLLTPPLHAQSEEDVALAFVKQHHPAIHARILALKATAPADYQSALDDAKKAAADHARIAATGDTEAAAAFVKMYAIDFAAIAITDRYLAATDEAQREDLRQQLRAKIAESFDQWVIVEQARVRRLEAEITKAKAAVDEAVKNRDKVIANDTEALIEESRSYQSSKPTK